MKQIKTTEAVGHILCHDITQIIKGATKDAKFRKGHVVREEDISVLLSLGKENLFIWEKEEGFLHENEAAEILYSVCENEYMEPSEIKEGKIECISTIDGVLEVNVDLLEKINALGDLMIATRHTNFPIKKGDKLAASRVIPLTIEKEKMDAVVSHCKGEFLLKIHPYKKKKIAIITTGSEIFKGRIKDAFGPVIRDKVEELPSEVIGQAIVDDNLEQIMNAISDYKSKGADFIICTGGMSVDPDDLTPTAIKNSGASLVSYGAPVLPGAMFLLAYFDDGTTVVGLPSCVMYAKRTIFDLVLPLIMSDKKISKSDIAKLGHGGLCLSCDACTFPQCGFGR